MKNKEIEKKIMKITYFVHSTTKDNEKSIASGRNESELSQKGFEQANELKEILKNQNFDIVFCSDLKRSIDTANIVFGEKTKIEQDHRLRECNYGDLNGSDKEIIEKDEKKYIYESFPNGESFLQVQERIQNFLEEIYKKYAGKNVAILAHKFTQHSLEVLLNGKTWEEAIEQDRRKTKKWKAGREYTFDGNFKTEAKNQESNNSKTKLQELQQEIIHLEMGKKEAEEITKKAQYDYINLKTDFDRYQRLNAEKEKNLEIEKTIDITKKFLPFIEDLRKVIEQIPSESQEDPVLKGVKIVFDKTIKNLETMGIKAIESIGLEPDSNLHEPINLIPTEDEKMKGKIIQEYERGFLYEKNGIKKVIVPSKVIIGQ